MCAAIAGPARTKQQKAERELLIPLHRDTAAALDPYKMQHIVIINTEYGKRSRLMAPADGCVTHFGRWPLDCNPHGLRKAAGRMPAEAGATAKNHGRARTRHLQKPSATWKKPIKRASPKTP
jgi:hypothetical protein